jgi:tol-pal system protein YbgF
MPRHVSALALALAPLLALGCARAETAQDKQLAEMREQMTRIQEDNDRFEKRLGVVEVAMADEKAPPAPPKAQAGGAGGANGTAATPPPPRVVQLGSDDDRASDDPNDASPRPKIEMTGSPSARGGRMFAPPPDARPSVLDPEAKRTYERGLAQVQGKQPDKGLETLAGFLVKWPDHPYAENAMYWRGEAYYAKGDYAKAAEQFEAVLSRFGGGSKAPDALLKLGMCQDKLGAAARAQEYWDRLKNEYPKSDAARHVPAAPPSDASRRGPKEIR